MSNALILAIAMVLDAVIGEPDAVWKKLPHPAVLMGRAVGWADRMMNLGQGRVVTGALVVASLTLGAWLAGSLLARIGWPVEVLAAAVLLAQRSLVDELIAPGGEFELLLDEDDVIVARRIRP